MSELYTVRMNRRQLVSTFDDKGRKIGEREELIPLTFMDLPYSTALTYRAKDPTAVLDRQYSSGRSERSTFKHSGSRAAPKAAKPAAAPTPSTKNTGTYGALVNAMGEE